ncbi:transposase [Natronobacterium gregoryi]|uniref:Transposase n=2 Tax=Natronobacterium gregoryi TaxID=44930 RepID=L0AHV9_NATGS|nr:transposase [Natronobacterium gregoryi]AFZ73029.1 Transposase [Natronobacterium gregoryi SP2]ELY70708.1 hypothetical protein C490_06219 [Natronobacterium gregoryi SP2]PLK20444.1 hypothetical protein CYV19_09965 [Natronobacterium gregoryi SP2]SFI63249.1 Transposase [Natronobacterium gregoryi]
MTDDICGEPTGPDGDGEPCQRAAGWGRDVDHGPCVDHADDVGGTGRRSELEQNDSIVDLVAGELQNGATVPEACAEAGISTSSYHEWRRKGEASDADADEDVFVEFLEETTRARRIGAKRDRERLKELIAETGDTRTWYKLHHDQYGDSYREEGGDGDAAEGIPLVVPENARPDS